MSGNTNETNIQKPSENLNDNCLVDTPQDNHCLFYCVVLSSLLPNLNDDNQFEQIFVQLFGENEDLKKLKDFLMLYDGTNEAIQNKGEILTNLICYKLRPKIAAYIENNPELFMNYMEDNEAPVDRARKIRENAWVGEPEIFAFSKILQRTIIVQSGDHCYHYDSENTNNALHQIELVHTSADKTSSL